MTEKVKKNGQKWHKSVKNGNKCRFMLSKPYFLVTIQQQNTFFANKYVNLEVYCSILAKTGYLGEYRSDQSKIWMDDSLGYFQPMYLGDKSLVDFCQFP